MIINHHYRFIYVKNARVASTSMEIALSKFCGEGDIITPISGKNERIRRQLGFTPPQNWKNLETGENEYWAHISAREIRAKVGEEIWNSYFKFAIERNPYDKVVSLYYHDGHKAQTNIALRRELEKFIMNTDRTLSNWDNYTDEDGNIIIDFMALYEKLYKYTITIEERIGLPSRIPIKRVNAASDKRLNHSRYREVLTKKARQRIYVTCNREIKTYGYEF